MWSARSKQGKIDLFQDSNLLQRPWPIFDVNIWTVSKDGVGRDSREMAGASLGQPIDQNRGKQNNNGDRESLSVGGAFGGDFQLIRGWRWGCWLPVATCKLLVRSLTLYSLSNSLKNSLSPCVLCFWLQDLGFLGVFDLQRHLHILQGHKLRLFYLGYKLGKNAASHCNPPLQFGNLRHSLLKHWPTLQILSHLKKAQSTQHSISLVEDSVKWWSKILEE